MGIYSQDIGHDAVALTPHNSTVQPFNRGGFVAVEGTVSIINRAGATLPTMTLPAGTYIPWRIHILRSTGTTATVLGVK